jgi:hypothetical protein
METDRLSYRILTHAGHAAVIAVLLLGLGTRITPAADTAAPGAPHYATTFLTDDEDQQQEKDVFGHDTPKIYVIATLADTPAGTPVKIVWIAEKTEVTPPDYDIISKEMQAGGLINRVTFSMSRPDNGWPAGMYRAELYIAGTLAMKIPFKVVQ